MTLALRGTQAPADTAPSVCGFPAVMMGGMPIAAMTRAETAAFMDAAAAKPRRADARPLYITSANGEVLSRADRDASIRKLFLAADMIHADGQSMVLGSRLGRGVRLPERVATTDLFHDAARLAERTGTTFYLLGGTAQTMDAAVERVQRAYPKLRIVGARNGYIAPGEENGVIEAINAARPGILWIGMGVPVEQTFVVRNRHRLNGVGVIKTSGGLFDFLAGNVSRAPRWMQATSLEWLYRTWLEPRRLLLRYLTTNPHALLILLRREPSARKAGQREALRP